jgi:hypothetical protein
MSGLELPRQKVGTECRHSVPGQRSRSTVPVRLPDLEGPRPLPKAERRTAVGYWFAGELIPSSGARPAASRANLHAHMTKRLGDRVRGD